MRQLPAVRVIFNVLEADRAENVKFLVQSTVLVQLFSPSMITELASVNLSMALFSALLLATKKKQQQQRQRRLQQPLLPLLKIHTKARRQNTTQRPRR